MAGPNSTMSMYMDRDEFGPIHVEGQDQIQACPCTWIGTYLALFMYRDRVKMGVSLYMDMDKYGPIHVQRHAWIHACPCTWTWMNMAMSMYNDML